MAKFTFKKAIHTGKYRSFALDRTDIKLNKKEVGHISESKNDYKYNISFAIKKEKTKVDPAPFKWITLKKKADSEPEARNFIKKNEEEIQKKYDLYQFED